VYKRRRHALFGERLLDIANMLYDTCEINHWAKQSNKWFQELWVRINTLFLDHLQ
jgi:hypothetical protein